MWVCATKTHRAVLGQPLSPTLSHTDTLGSVAKRNNFSPLDPRRSLCFCVKLSLSLSLAALGGSFLSRQWEHRQCRKSHFHSVYTSNISLLCPTFTAVPPYGLVFIVLFDVRTEAKTVTFLSQLEMIGNRFYAHPLFLSVCPKSPTLRHLTTAF